MTHHDDLDYCMYSLTGGNPYIERRLDLSRPEHVDMLLEFAGYPALSEIRQQVERTVKEQRTTAFLISGREGTGRSTLADAIIHHYVQHRGIADTFHLVKFDRRERIDHNSATRIYTILKKTRNAILNKGNREHEDRLKSIISDGTGDGLDDYDLQERAESLAYFAEKATPKIHLGLLIDGIQEDSFMKSLAITFERIPIVVVAKRDHYNLATTADSDRLEQRAVDWQTWAEHITLPPLNGAGFGLLADSRWTIAAPDVNCPFDLDGLAMTFAERPEPVRRALKWLEWLLWYRLKGYKGNEPWPASQELALTAEWIEDTVYAYRMAPVHHAPAPR